MTKHSVFNPLVVIISFAFCIDAYPGKCLKPYMCETNIAFKKETLRCLEKCYDIDPIKMRKDKQPHRECRKKLFNHLEFTDKDRLAICGPKRIEYRKCLRSKARLLAEKVKDGYQTKKLKKYAHERQDCIYECIKKQFGSLMCNNPKFPGTQEKKEEDKDDKDDKDEDDKDKYKDKKDEED